VFTKGALKKISVDFECPWGVSSGCAIFFSILAMNIAYYSSLPKASNLAPPELMRNTG
jgi:hypothetical protein